MGLRKHLKRFRSFWIFPLISLVLLAIASRSAARAGPFLFAFWFATGVILWTFIEYCFHRFFFHIRLRNKQLQAFFNGSHYFHHATPRDPDLILVHPLFGMAISAILFAALYGIFRSLFAPAAILTGIWAGFLYYEAVHYRVHCSLSSSPLLQYQRRAHFYHHFSNVNRNFGVTSPFWDSVCGTRFKNVESEK